MAKKERDIALDTFVSTISHDLRTPLSAIHLSAALIMQDVPSGPRGERIKSRVAIIQRQVATMIRMVTTLLDAEKISAGKLPLNKQDVDASEDLLEVLDEFMPVAVHADIVLDVAIPERPCPACYDKDRIKQVLSNLISNALRFATKGSTVTLLVKADDEPGFIRFEVSNFGEPIAEDKRQFIFERYSKGADAHSHISHGLGLWIARWIVEEHGGKIWVDPTPDGNIFCFKVPKNK